ncbi:uncharacterized protein [Oryza sativa Japonica Group]|uniref:Uncharacterized protein n=4 Tax=Oryza TaxID=4527 RepID=Q9LWT3_ORYSJ|nr:uncharacterized protein LOC4339913 isoform X1 [Oryza sativa Japonica Group]XP_025882363.1 uncharacterized protein LOC4339913 isoform X1 [Oryza sativa Japonica Group]XP_052158049.1 uncharacterized protein LOC127775795 isoform X1 [Oryza glaberrima]XP_052158050.1 uncharacterized protein LOC127775795 isoform X1 [Oryza glaberrima]KAF2924843.1 hypothetical protein DAI22_06g008700 [Oryza sativa Japonica Group]BAA92727.1 unknown protein [Oryza sativa Japonica Group]BAD67901.1 unknown protein [Oryz
MAARALSAAAAAAGRRMAGQTGFPLLASCRRGDQAHQNYSISAQAQPEEEQKAIHDGGGAAGAQVEAALNRKNVEVHPEEETVEDAWVPDHETGVFVPADEAAVSGTENHDHCGAAAAAAGGSPSVLDQAVFVREEDMEDVERPAVDMAAANHKPK